jgi:regulatory protein
MTAFERAVKLLAGRPKTRARLAQALLARGHLKDEVDAALTRAQQLGYLDDRRYAEARARAALSEGRAPKGIVHKLAADGVDEHVAEAAVSAAAQEAGYDPKAAAQALVRKRRLIGPKAARFLAGRGFSEDVIRTVVRLDD